MTDFCADSFSLLRSRGFQPENDAQNQHRHKQQTAEKPSAGVIQSAGRKEQDQPHQEKTGKIFCQS